MAKGQSCRVMAKSPAMAKISSLNGNKAKPASAKVSKSASSSVSSSSSVSAASTASGFGDEEEEGDEGEEEEDQPHLCLEEKDCYNVNKELMNK